MLHESSRSIIREGQYDDSLDHKRREPVMPLVKTCPGCNGRMTPIGTQEHLRSIIRNPRRVKCTHCGSVYKASRGYWYVAHLGGLMTAVGSLGLLGLTVDLISPKYTLESFLITALGISIVYFGLWRVRLEDVNG